jgi:hypothetical protein
VVPLLPLLVSGDHIFGDFIWPDEHEDKDLTAAARCTLPSSEQGRPKWRGGWQRSPERRMAIGRQRGGRRWPPERRMVATGCGISIRRNEKKEKK